MKKRLQFLRRLIRQQQGYSLIVIVLLFAAFAAATAAYLDRNTVQQKIDRTVETRAQLARLSNAILQYYYFNGNHYPCPASTAVSDTSGSFGAPIECSSSGTLSTCPSGSPCKLDSENVRGMVPVRALINYGIDLGDAFDAWNDRIMYVVNRELTTNGSGTVSTRPTLKEVNTNTTLDAPNFLLISYGPDRVGGILRGQTATAIACASSATNTREENCDNDTSFYTANANTPSTATNSTYSGTLGTNYFDDIVSSVSPKSVVGCANGATNPPACNTCSDGQPLSANMETGTCTAYLNDGHYYDGEVSQAKTRASCSASWTDAGDPDTSDCVMTSCANGSTNYPTCNFAYTCTETTCSAPANTGGGKWGNCAGTCASSWAGTQCSPYSSSVQGTSCGTVGDTCYFTSGTCGTYSTETVFVSCTCASTACAGQTCDAPDVYGSNTDISGTTGDPCGAGGTTITCVNNNYDGVCAETPGECDVGTVTGYTSASCGGTATWTCAGKGTGSNASCSYAYEACTSCGTTAISGYDSGLAWRGPVQTPNYNVTSTGGVTSGQRFVMTTDTAGSSWHPEAHNWTFTQGVAASYTYAPYDSKNKSTRTDVYYNGGSNFYAVAYFTRNKHASNWQWVRVQITGINTCTTTSGSGGTSTGGCFLGTTEVTMEDGSKKPISDLKKGDRVKGSTRINTVVFPETHQSDETLYGINGGPAFVTGEHMLMTTKGWRSIDPALALKESHGKHKVQKLEIGDLLMTQDGTTTEVQSIDPHTNMGTMTLYNPALNGDHTYYANGIMVHNLKCTTQSCTSNSDL